MEERQVAGSIRPFSRRGLHGLRRGLHGLRRGLHGLQARITRITGADYADYITPITRREILARTTTPSNLNNNNQYLFLLLSHLHIYDENILYS